MLDKTFIEKIEALSNRTIIEHEGRPFATGGGVIALEDNLPSPVKLTTLSGLTKFNAPTARCFFNIENASKVVLVAEDLNRWGRRPVYAVADVSDYLPSFQSGYAYSQENAIVTLNTCFHRDEALLKVLQAVSSIKIESADEIADDGVTQTVSAKSGVMLKARIDLPNPVTLKPIVTFDEIEPTEREYILRVGSKNGAVISLYEVQSRVWELAIMEKIRAYLKSNGKFPCL